MARSGGITVKFWTSVSMFGSCWSFLETSDDVVELRSSLTSMIFVVMSFGIEFWTISERPWRESLKFSPGLGNTESLKNLGVARRSF